MILDIRTWPALLVMSPLLFLWPAPAARDVALTERMHHLRSGTEREWAGFPERAEGTELKLSFQAKPNATEWTVRIRHRDLKQAWRVLVNGQEIARLPLDEADTITYWPIPPQTLRDSENELRVHCTATASDDVMVGEIAVIERPKADVVSDATVDVIVTDQSSGRGIPSRLTVADEHGTLVATGNTSGADHAVRPGVVYARAGTARLHLPAGKYVVYAGRGFEYSVASTRVDVSPGQRVSRRLAIRREVDTSGWASMDTHIHTGTHARHGDATVEERMLTIVGEGLELPVSTEHNLRIAFEASAQAGGVRNEFTPILGSEVTTPALGHFNVFPLQPEGHAIDHRAADWARLRENIHDSAGNPVIVLNHGRDLHGGFRPLGRGRHISIAGESLDGPPLPANAMEIVNSGAVMSDALALPSDWMGMLNRGLTLTPTGSSDSHDVSRYIVGQGRTYVRVEGDDPGALDPGRVLESVRDGRVTVSYGLLTEIDVNGSGPGEVYRSTGDLNIRLRVKGPGWTSAERIALYANGERVREEKIRSGTVAGLKWEATWRLPQPRHDVHLVAIATGPGVTAPYWPTAKPYQPTSIEFTPYVLGVTGAVFVDADGSGTFDSAFDYARREVSSTPDIGALAAKLARYDGAVAIQAASLLRAQDPDRFEPTIERMIKDAPPRVARGLDAYRDAWNQTRHSPSVAAR